MEIDGCRKRQRDGAERCLLGLGQAGLQVAGGGGALGCGPCVVALGPSERAWGPDLGLELPEDRALA